MSLHKVPLTELELEGLKAYGLAIGTPSQLSDCFRHGIYWAVTNINKYLYKADTLVATESLYHAVIVTNKAEKAYIMEWLEGQGIDSSKLEGLFKFPFLVYTVDGTWMTEYERVGTTVSFREFIKALEV